MRMQTFLAATLAATLVAGCATHKTKPNVANPYVVAVGGTTGSLSADTDIQILSVSAGTNRPPDLVPDATLLEPSLQTPVTNPPLNAIPLPNMKDPRHAGGHRIAESSGHDGRDGARSPGGPGGRRGIQ